MKTNLDALALKAKTKKISNKCNVQDEHQKLFRNIKPLDTN